MLGVSLKMMSCSRIYLLVFAVALVIIVAYTASFTSLLEFNLWSTPALYKNSDENVINIPKSLTNRGSPPENPHEITVVTMYIKLDSFQKGSGSTHFSRDTYKNWMTTWGWLTNRVVAFFDNEEVMDYFRKIRASQPADRTVLLMVNRTRLPGFRYYDKISEIYRNSSYPKHPPNTVNAGYSCTMNAKYDAIQIAIERNLVPTKHLVWLDIGYFRTLLKPNYRPKNDSFTLEVPDGFNSDSIAMGQVGSRDALKNLSPWELIRDNQVWVSGGFFLGTKEVLLQFSKNFASAVDYLIARNMSSTDQQVIASMYSPALLNLQKVNIMTSTCEAGKFGLYGSDQQYFALGYICKEAAEIRKNNDTKTDLYTKCKFTNTLTRA